jgi:hypothetical protein
MPPDGEINITPGQVILIFVKDVSLITHDYLSGELMNAQLRALPAHGLAVQACRARRPLSGPNEH